MVLSKILGKSNSKEESLEDIETQVQEKDSKIQEIRGEQQLEDLKKQKRQQLKQKKKELKKKEFEQTRAGQLLDNLGSSLESLSNSIDGSSREEKSAKQSLENISNNLEVIDGDGRKDNSRAVEFFGTREPINKDDVIGTVEVDGAVELESGQRESKNRLRKREDDGFDINTEIDMGF